MYFDPSSLVLALVQATLVASAALALVLTVVTSRRLGLLRLELAEAVRGLRTDDRGEGVISMAIAVLIVAFLGVALWLAFKGFADDTERTLEDQVDQIGS